MEVLGFVMAGEFNHKGKWVRQQEPDAFFIIIFSCFQIVYRKAK